MLQLRSTLTVADNSGAVEVYMIGMRSRGNKKIASVGEVINVVVKKGSTVGQVKKGEKLQAVIVRTRKEKRRRDGSYIRFDDNACVVLAGVDTKEPKGTRIFGPVAREVKECGFSKIASLAQAIY